MDQLTAMARYDSTVLAIGLAIGGILLYHAIMALFRPRN